GQQTWQGRSGAAGKHQGSGKDGQGPGGPPRRRARQARQETPPGRTRAGTTGGGARSLAEEDQGSPKTGRPEGARGGFATAGPRAGEVTQRTPRAGPTAQPHARRQGQPVPA